MTKDDVRKALSGTDAETEDFKYFLKNPLNGHKKEDTRRAAMIYISGPISNLANYRKVFAEVTKDAERRFGGEWHNPAQAGPLESYTATMAADLKALAKSDAVLHISYYYRNGSWETSQGRDFECYCALVDGKPVFDVDVCERPGGKLDIVYEDDTIAAIKEFLQ